MRIAVAVWIAAMPGLRVFQRIPAALSIPRKLRYCLIVAFRRMVVDHVQLPPQPAACSADVIARETRANVATGSFGVLDRRGRARSRAL